MTTSTRSPLVGIPSIAAQVVDDAREDVAGARRWFGLAIGSLVVAGALALILVIGRMPPFDQMFSDPLLFKRGLVVHVVLALVVWFFAFIGGLWRLLPSARPASPLAQLAPALSAAGIVAMVLAAAWPGSEPVLANYVPMIDNPLFVAGVIAFGAGLLLGLVDHRFVLSGEHEPRLPLMPAVARPALRAAGVAVLIAALCFLSSALSTPSSLPAHPYFEAVVWGGGHVLQFASSAAMCAVWLALATAVTGKAPLSRRAAAILFGLFIAPLFAAPLLADTGSAGSRTFFTRLMELAIFPTVTIVLVACVVALVRAARARGTSVLRDPRALGFFASAALAILGFFLGASIDGSNTMIPAHYHASIGAVTAAFMTFTYELMVPLGLGAPGPRTRRLARWQPLVYGAGQMVFAVGFGIAGAHGLARKTYGVEQVADDGGRTLGLVVMGIGGLVAVAAGLAFLGACLSAWRRRTRVPVHSTAVTRSAS